MSQPPEYERQYDFSDFSASNPDDQQPGQQIDAELDAVKVTTDAINANLALIQRDDGELVNQLVTVDSLAADVLASLGVTSVWATATAFAVGDVTFYNNAIYTCLVAHTSGTFVTDLNAGKWDLVIDYGSDVFRGTSTTSLAVSIASKVFTTQVEKGFAVGDYVLAVSDAAPTTNTMHGQVTAYSGTSLTVNVTTIQGSGTHADWTIRLSGSAGPSGAAGASGSVPIATAGGTADAITANFTPDISLADLTLVCVIADAANTSATPTFAPDGLTARTIVKKGGQALVAGDIYGAGMAMLLEYNLANTRWELLNPAATIVTATGDVSGTSVASGALTLTIGAAKVTEAMQVLADNTTNDVSTSKHGYVPKAPNDVAQFLNGLGAFSTPSTASSVTLNAQSDTYTLAAGDKGKLVSLTGSSSKTWSFTAAATLGDGWWCYVSNDTTNADIILDPNSTETIDALTSYRMLPGEVRLIQCTGTAFNSRVVKGFRKTYSSSNTFTTPPGYRAFLVEVRAGGGSGGKGSTQAGGGGGGGAYNAGVVPSTALGATAAVTVGAGGAAQATVNTSGNVGGTSDFDTKIYAYGGGGGRGANAATNGGGGGGGSLSAGHSGPASDQAVPATITNLLSYFSASDGIIGATAGVGGRPYGGIPAYEATALAGSSYAGGGAGGSSTAGGASAVGGSAVCGGGGGGRAGDASLVGGAGGPSVFGGGGGGGGAQDSAPGAGAGGASTFGGAGGAGAYDANNATAGTQPSGGGGGSESGSSGAGGDGSVIITGIA